ncbi:MAG: response regulator [Pseudohongiella sp.]|nr:response regulator [Pseudohongiella sp.]
MQCNTHAVKDGAFEPGNPIPVCRTPQPVRVLLADAGELLRQQLTAMLSDANCEVMAAADGFEVLCRLPELRPDVLLIASDLPRLSGIQVCSLLRQSPDFAALPVLILTGANALVDRVRAELAGANACLEKPFRRSELQAAFSAVFDGQLNPGRASSTESVDHVLPSDC